MAGGLTITNTVGVNNSAAFSAGLFTLVLLPVGVIGGLIVAPKDRHYYEFINTINSKSENEIGFD